MKHSELSDWLAGLGLEAYFDVLVAEGYEAPDDLIGLQESDLEKLGFKMKHRKDLQKALTQRSSAGSSAGASEEPLPRPEQSPGPTDSPATANGGPALDLPNLGRTDTPLKLFLSYGRDDLVQEVRAVRDALRARGHEVWFDEEQLDPGKTWDQRIDEGLQWCDKVVLTMTPHSVRQPDGFCLNELAKALERHKEIIPLLVAEVPGGAPITICRIQYLDIRRSIPAAQQAAGFLDSMQRLCRAIEKGDLDYEGGQQYLRSHLRPLDFAGDIEGHVARFVGRQELQKRLRAWLDDPAASQVLWLTGSPGLGKSAIAARLAHGWAEIDAMHFCRMGIQDTNDPASAILSIAYQLSQRLDTYRARLSRLELEREAQKPDPGTLFNTLLVAQFSRQYPVPEKPCVVILDGLDEATQPDGSNPLAEVLAAQWRRLPRWLRLIVSSRPDAEVQGWLTGAHTLSLSGSDPEQQADLSVFLRQQLQAMGRSVSEAVLQRILVASEGAFHYVVRLVEDAREGLCNPEDPVDLPPGMNTFYLQSFRRRFRDAAEYRLQCRPLLALVLASPEPLPLQVMAQVEGIDAFEVRERLLRLGSMVVMEPAQAPLGAEWDMVRLVHASLRTWLTGLDERRMPLAQAFAVQPAVKALAGQVLNLWDKSGGKEGEKVAPMGFVARTLWPLLKALQDEAAMERVGFDLSLYWEHRRLALAIEPAEFAAEAGLRSFEAGVTEPVALEGGGKCLGHLGGLQVALGRSGLALSSFRRSLAILERLAAQDLDNMGWQSGLAATYNRIGGVLESQGNLAGALEEFRKALAIRDRLAAQDPDNAGWQSELAATYNRIGGVLESQGNLAGGLEEFRKALAIRDRLAAQDPDNAGLQGKLSESQDRIGRVLRAQGNLAGALEEHRKSQAIMERLAAQDPDNARWQRNLGVRYNRIGGVLEAQGDLAGALEEHRKDQAIMQRLVVQDPDNADWQRELSVSNNRIGAVLESQGNLAGALEEFQKELGIIQLLVAQDPDNADWQNSLAGSYNRIGGVLEAQGNLAGALEEFQKALAIRKCLAAQDPDNMGWQNGLATSHSRIGGALEAQGKLSAALKVHRRSKAIMERLAAQDPSNAGWQYSLAGTHNRIGGVLEHQGSLAEALEEFRKSLIIRERLVAHDPEDTRWLNGLAISYNRIGDLLKAQGNLAGALEEFHRNLIIRERLAAQDPDNAGWQSELAATYNRIGGVLESQGNLAGGLEEFRKALAIRDRLAAQDPDNAGWQRDKSVSQIYVAALQMNAGRFELASALLSQATSSFLNLISKDGPGTLIDYACAIALRAEIEEHLQDDKALEHSLCELLDLDLQVEGVTGAFRKRFLPTILLKMSRALAYAETERRTPYILRALRLSAAAPHADKAFWKHAAREILTSLSPGHKSYEELRAIVEPSPESTS